MTTVSSWSDLALRSGRGVTPWVAAGIPAWAAPRPLSAALIGLFALLGSSWLHEAAHVAAYWWARGGPEPVVVRSTYSLATSVTVERPRLAESRVALAGPASASLAGLACIGIAWATGSLTLWTVGCALLVHLLGVFPGSSDGNRIWGLSEPVA